MSNVYVIADLHLGHTDIHKKWRNKFSSQQEHDEFIIAMWNSIVRSRDVVKVLGDFIIGRKNLHYLKELKGTIHIIGGNHDVKFNRELFNDYPNVSYVSGVEIYKGVVLSHVPVHPLELGTYRGWQYNMHGHQHRQFDLGHRYFNVNADVIGFSPREFKTLCREAEWKLDCLTT